MIQDDFIPYGTSFVLWMGFSLSRLYTISGWNEFPHIPQTISLSHLADSLSLSQTKHALKRIGIDVKMDEIQEVLDLDGNDERDI